MNGGAHQRPQRRRREPNFLAFAARLADIRAKDALVLARVKNRQLKRQLADQDRPATDEERKIMNLCDFMETRERPDQLSIQEKVLYGRIAEKQGAEKQWPQNALDSFDE